MQTNQFNSPKLFCHAKKIAKYQDKKTVFPISIDLSPSNYCNHNCVWCVYAKYLNKSQDMLDKEALLSLIDNLSKVGVKGINFTGGGEPLVNKFTVEAMEKAHSLGMDVGIITNGGLLNENIMNRLKSICKYIRISLDAGTPETHAKFHNVGINEFDKILNNINYLCKLNLNSNCAIGVQLLQVQENVHETLPIINRLKEFGVSFVEVRPVVDVNQTINEVKNVNEEYFIALENVVSEQFKVIVRRDRFETRYGCGKDYNKCTASHFLATFGADGLVYSCCEFMGSKDYVIGNFIEESLESIFEFEKLEKKITQLNLSVCPKFCKADGINNAIASIENTIHPNIL